MAMMTSPAKPARAPSKEARKLADMLWWILGSGGSARQGAITEAAAHIDEHVAHRLSTALLDPKAVEAAARVYGPAAFIDTEGWSEPEAAFQATVKAAQVTHMEAAIRAAIEVAAEHPISAAIAPSALLNPSEVVVQAGVQAYLDCRSVNLNTVIERVLRAAAMKIIGHE